MEFCPKCGSLLVKKKTKFGCPRCNYMAKETMTLKTKEEVNESRPVAVVKEKQGEIHPITDHVCRRCKNDKAYFWIRQMRAGDEPESKFYQCTKCKDTERVDD